MDGTDRENRKHPVDPEKRKYLRFMQVGLSCILAWPVVIMLAAMYGLESLIPDVSVLMVVVGVVIFTIGYEDRKKLAERMADGETKLRDQEEKK